MLSKMDGSSSTMRMRCLRRLVMKGENAISMDGTGRIGKCMERAHSSALATSLRESGVGVWFSGTAPWSLQFGAPL